MVYHSPLGVVYTGPSDSTEIFPGLIPGLGGGLPGYPVSIPIKTSETVNALMVASEPNRFASWEELEPVMLDRVKRIFAERIEQLEKVLSEIPYRNWRLKGEVQVIQREQENHARRINQQMHRDMDEVVKYIRAFEGTKPPPGPLSKRLEMTLALLESNSDSKRRSADAN